MKPKIFCVGHRGAKGLAPENTLLAIQKALDLGVDGIEIDVHLVQGKIVVIHDDRLDRTTNGKGLLAAQSFEYLRSLDAGQGQHIPILEEVIELIDQKCWLNIEFKCRGLTVPTIEIIKKFLRRGWSQESFLISSFDHRELQSLKQLSPALRIGALVYGVPLENAKFASDLGAYSLHASSKFLDSEFVADAHKRGLKVYVYTVNERDQFEIVKSLNVDAVFSDYPDQILNWRSST